MRCEKLLSEKLGSVPLVECGGVTLQPGDVLLVREDLAQSMKKHYGPLLMSVGVEDRTSLKYGTYEVTKYSKPMQSESAVVHAAKHEGEEVPCVVASDKSMQGKLKFRSKR